LWVNNKLGGILYDRGKKKRLFGGMLDGWNEILTFIKDRAKRFLIFESLLSIEYDKCFEMRKDRREDYREAVSYILANL